MTDTQPTADCALCQLEGAEEGRLPGGDVIVAYVDDELVGLIRGELPGVFLAPREHTEKLVEAPERSSAVLAALRVLVEHVKWAYDVEAATIGPTTDFPAAQGHVCYHVAPTLPGRRAGESDPETRARQLAEVLRRHAAAQRRQRSGIQP